MWPLSGNERSVLWADILISDVKSVATLTHCFDVDVAILGLGPELPFTCRANGDEEEDTNMNSSLATKRDPGVLSGFKSGMLVVFYLLTFLTGGFFLFAGNRLGLVVDLGAAMFYIAVTVLFYSLSTGSNVNE